MIPDTLKEIPAVAAVESWDPTAIIDGRLQLGEVTVEVPPERIVEVARHLKEQLQFVRLSTVTAVDRYPLEPRFEVVYHLHSLERNERLRVKSRPPAGEKYEIDSVYGVWRSADWYEREVFDLFGIYFRNHPNLKRIMMPEDWAGHPLRKDYPVHGYRYSYAEEK